MAAEDRVAWKRLIDGPSSPRGDKRKYDDSPLLAKSRDISKTNDFQAF